MKYLFIFLLFVSYSYSLEKEFIKDNQYGLYYTLNLNISENTQLTTYYQTRRLLPDKSNHDQFDISISYKLENNIKIGAGFTYFLLHLPQTKNTPIEIVPQEFRPNQYLIISNNLTEKLKYSNRILLEERFFQTIEDNKLTDNYNFSLRFRFLTQFNYDLLKINSDKFNFGLYLSDELLIHYGKNIVFNVFDQNRFQIGFFYNYNKNVSVQLGYMQWFQETNNFTNESFFYISRNTLVFSLTNNFDLYD